MGSISSGHAITIGSSLRFGGVTNPAAALDAILAEWATEWAAGLAYDGPAGSNTIVQNMIKGTGLAAGYGITSSSVIDDLAIDTLTDNGAAGTAPLSWYVFNQNTTGTTNRVTKKAAETATKLP